MTKYILIFTTLFLYTWSFAQSYETRTGHLYVKSSSQFMDVEANNYQVYSDVDFTNATVNFVGLMKSWEFELGAIDRAFNSDRINLEGYRKFRFEGKIVNPQKINIEKAGRYEIKVRGPLFIGEYKREMVATAICYVKEDQGIDVESDFTFQIEEGNMEQINKLMKERLPQIVSLDAKTLGISRTINVKLYLSYKPK